MKRRPLEETLLALRRVRQAPGSEASQRELRQVLGGEGSHAVARAAALVGELGLEALVPDLVAAFPRFFEEPERADPGCSAKTAIVEALRRLEQDERALYRRGAAHVQMEPVFGGRVDTAVDLRGTSALALAESAGGDVLVDLAHLLADPEAPVRASAARAVAVHGRDGGVPLLHLKALAGDAEPRVVAECLLSVLRLDPRDGLAFVASFFDRETRPRRQRRSPSGSPGGRTPFPCCAAGSTGRRTGGSPAPRSWRSPRCAATRRSTCCSSSRRRSRGRSPARRSPPWPRSAGATSSTSGRGRRSKPARS